jgi:hypothetical protein
MRTSSMESRLRSMPPPKTNSTEGEANFDLRFEKTNWCFSLWLKWSVALGDAPAEALEPAATADACGATVITMQG